MHNALYFLKHETYNVDGCVYIGYSVYPAGATPEQFPAYKLLTDDPVPLYDEYMAVRERTGNFDPTQEWKSE